MTEDLRLTASETVTVVRSEPEALEVEGTYGPKGSLPPKHFHPDQDESFRIISGQLMTKVDGVERELGEGDALEIPRGAVHQMWNASDTDTRVWWRTSPAGRTEDWFRAVDSLQSEAGEGEPSPLAFGVLLREYDDTFRLAVGPKAASGPLAFALGALGRLRGHRVPDA